MAFLWPVLIGQKTFIFGDYWQQHYPWAHEYSQSLLRGKLPYWVPGMACGFPLVAEGQVGAYYLLNLLFYRTMPFLGAYNFSVLFHVLAGGLGFYFYLKKSGTSSAAAAIGASLFSFSSGYGGCFSNTATLRAMVWLPWCLLALDMFAVAPRAQFWGWISLIGVIISQMWTAGSTQMALYASGYILIYWLIGQGFRKLVAVVAMFAVGAALSAPQWLSTMELLSVSVRSGENTFFAMWGSVFPPAVASLVYPKWGDTLGISFYIGEAAVCLLLAGAFSKKSAIEKSHYMLAILFIFLAFGKYNPLYKFVVEYFSLTFFRNPSKLLFFSCISLCVAAACGYDHLCRLSQDAEQAKRFRAWLAYLSGLVVLGPLVANIVFKDTAKWFQILAQRYAQDFFSQKKDPVHDLTYYQARAEVFFLKVQAVFGYTEPWILTSLVFFLLSVIVVMRISRGDKTGRWKKIALPVVLGADLLVFGFFLGSGFIGNARDLPSNFSAPLVNQTRQYQESTGSQVVEWAKNQDQELLAPNAQLYYGLKSPAGYSPLMIKNYYDLTRELGIVDSSLGRYPFSQSDWSHKRSLLRLLGVGMVVSDEKLHLSGSSLYSRIRQTVPKGERVVSTEKYCYQLDDPAPMVYAVYDWKILSDAGERLAYLKDERFDPLNKAVVEMSDSQFMPTEGLGMAEGEVTLEESMLVEADIHLVADGLAIFRSVQYPGWKVRIDGVQSSLITVDHVFCGTFLKKGTHHLKFYYDNERQKLAEKGSMLMWAVLFYSNFLLWKRRRNVSLKPRS